MAFFKPLRAWQKLAPDTIESWLVSDDKREQHLADEALQQLGADKARTYLYSLLTKELQVKEGRALLGGIGFAGVMIANLSSHFAKTPFAVSAVVSIYLVGIALCLVSWLIGRTTTKLQRRLMERAVAKPSLDTLPILLRTYYAVDAPKMEPEVEAVLPALLRQVSPETQDLIPEEYWQHTVQFIWSVARFEGIHLHGASLDIAKARLEACRNARYEPALPALEALSKKKIKPRTATGLPATVELKNLAAQCVATWNDSPAATRGEVAAPENVPLTAGKWYAR